MVLRIKYDTKKYVTATATAVIAATIVAVPTNATANPFSDLHEGQYYYEDVLALQERGIISGYPDGTFKPNHTLTRGQAAKMIAGFLKLDTDNVPNPNFTDISPSNQYYGAIAALKAAGIIDGYEDQTFRHNTPIERNHMAKIIANAVGLEAKNPDLLPFIDVSDSYKSEIAALYEHKITTGKTPTTFEGNKNVTRGQMAAFIIRAEKALQSIPQQPETVTISIDELTTTTVISNNETYTLSETAQQYLNEQNKEALQKAQVIVEHKNGVIEKVKAITLNHSGTAEKLVTFTTAATLEQLTVNADYVKLENVNVTGNVVVTEKAATELKLNNVKVTGEVVVKEQPQVTASLQSVAQTTSTLKLTAEGGTIGTIVVERPQLQLVTDTPIAQLKVAVNVTYIDVTGTIKTFTVESTKPLEITGSATIEQLEVLQTTELKLAIDGIIAALKVAKPDVKVSLGKAAKITNLQIPAGAEANKIVDNFNQVISQIGTVTIGDTTTPVLPSPGGGGGGGGSNQPQPKNFTLSIMHNNDTHANLNNIPKTVTAIKEYRKTKPNALLLNAGDVFSGTLYFNTFEGEADLALMKLMGYDAMTLGNHEFDLGASEAGHQALVDFITGANFPIVSSNVDFSKDAKFTGLFSDLISSDPENGKIYNGIIKEIDGEKVGIFGLTTAETKDISSPGSVAFEDYLEEAEKAVKAFEGMGVNKIVALTHLGYDDNPAVDNDLSLAKHVDGIDVIVGGHSHTELKEPVVVDKDEKGVTKDKTVIVQAGQYNSYLGTLDVTFNAQGKVVIADGELVSIGAQAEDEEAVAVLKPFKDKVNEVSAEAIGVTLKQALTTPRSSDPGNTTGVSVRNSETILGNIITDGMLAKSKVFTDKEVIMAVQNGGGIRAAIDAGPVTVGEVITVLPFGNTLAVMDITGKEVKEMFEHSVSQAPKESGGFLHVSGAKVRYDSTKPAGERVVSIEYKNADGQYVAIESGKTYTIATNAFTAKGGDGFTMLQKAYEDGRVTDLGLSDWENLKEQFLAIKDSIPTSTEGRIIDVALETVTLTPSDLAGGTKENPIVIKENAVVDLSAITKLEHVVFEGNVTFNGTALANLQLTNIKVNGKLDISAVTGNVDIDGIEAEGLEL